ncbi:STAS domain-containing protein [Actinoplanes sp. HUAS TT8]|uniref:STAS domain-containing protein n=1 Tax=Actinoplanes sp. HUAS TT8 TaxID=3447453 RepID=UPI003F520993
MDDQTYTLTVEAGDTDADGRRAVVLKIRGALDISGRDDLVAAITGIVAGDCERLVVDLSEATFMDSEALGALLEGYSAAEKKGVPMTATGAHGIVYRVLQITGLLTVLQHP